MNVLMEQHDTLHAPYEAFLYDSCHNAFPIKAHWHDFMEDEEEDNYILEENHGVLNNIDNTTTNRGNG